MADQTLPTPEEVALALAPPEDDPLSKLTKEEAEIVAKILPLLADKANKAAEVKKAKELQSTIEALTQENIKMRDQELQKIRDSNKPPDPKELEKLLTQEYLEFAVKLPTGDGVREFVITELPQSAETRLFNTIKKKLVPALKELSAVEWNSSMTTATKLERVIESIPLALDTMAELTAICLNPFGKAKDITAEWARNNVSSVRQMNIIEAQIMASRFRDFFSALSHNLPGMIA
jgi:hypothetical protein